MNKNRSIQLAIEILGGQKKLGEITGTTQPNVWKWLHNKQKVKADYVPLIVKATNGVVKACELRPDLPELFPPE
ncbi:helix-turn-helix domain-containing protein [Gilliamella sp. ESL0232]|jgi:DNA-binding transcriptional regulator YdaS (Cro superfamily)|uniref:Putative antitoxin of toxin-antitoxin system, YdaS/YdaT n=1 Tax=Gilliamella intestini TaxID=1798183 RepID=A0A1C4BXZ1_9GAMM|nr:MULTISPECIES: helix-turn-helix domain-containing protein [Gilliamella]MWN32118.1 transcriptional regulator [Gilliamella sp. Pra-s60]MWP29377.1 transcriptional regulator [Gilliamella sp. Pra-s54]NUE95184.1 helix-turn-helix domain-containing protein [Gilliamella sp. ESL0232]NUF26881.1 helix-turn-helix domain-containing protein [Gilliamella sp. ESL0254]SCC11670.1 Putative antitoxin of toxin-antitoxin system, YdaS/YdaT [Gilliamella intestini]